MPRSTWRTTTVRFGKTTEATSRISSCPTTNRDHHLRGIKKLTRRGLIGNPEAQGLEVLKTPWITSRRGPSTVPQTATRGDFKKIGVEHRRCWQLFGKT